MCLYFDQFELFFPTFVQNLEVGAYIRPSTFIRDPRVSSAPFHTFFLNTQLGSEVTAQFAYLIVT